MGQTRYSEGEFTAQQKEVRDRLSELAFLDWSMEYLDYRPDGQSTDFFEYHHVTLGWTYPFSYGGYYLNDAGKAVGIDWPDKAQLEQTLATQKSAADEWATRETTGIPSTVSELTQPDPEVFKSVAQALLDKVATPLSTLVADDFAGLQKSLGDWEGHAADSFATNFYNPFGDCQENQAWLAGELAKLLGASAAILDLGRNSIMNVVATVNEALDQQLRFRQQQNKAPSTKETLTMTAEIAGLLALVPTPGAAGSAVFGGLGAVLGFAADKIPDSGGEVLNITGATALELAGDLGRISTLVVNAERAWQNLESGRVEVLSKALEKVMQPSVHLLYPRRPDLADGPVSPQDFHHDSSDQYD